MKIVFVALIALLCAAFAHGEGINYGGDIPAFGLLNAVENCDTVALGTVRVTTGVLREFGICTDVMFEVETLIKGETNVGKDHIKFFYAGGEVYDPEIKDIVGLHITPGVKFEVGERVLLFLQKGEKGYPTHYPYGGRRVYSINFGKRLVEDGNVSFKYNKNNSATDIGIPVDAAVKLAQAFVRNKEEAKTLETEIKDLVSTTDAEKVSETLAASLVTRAKLIKEKKK